MNVHKHNCIHPQNASVKQLTLLSVLVQDLFALNQNEALQNFDVICLFHKLYQFYELRKKNSLKYKKKIKEYASIIKE